MFSILDAALICMFAIILSFMIALLIIARFSGFRKRDSFFHIYPILLLSIKIADQWVAENGSMSCGKKRKSALAIVNLPLFLCQSGESVYHQFINQIK